MKAWHRIQPALAIGISVLVLLICIAITAGTWIVQGKVASAAVILLDAVDTSAQALRGGVDQVDNGLERIEESILSIEDTSQQLAQNVNDQGLVRLLLPEQKEQELATAAQSVQADFADIRDLLNAVNEVVQAVNNLPFVELPARGLAAIESLQDGMDRLAGRVDELRTDIQAFRSGTAARISRITTGAANLNNQVDGLRLNLAQVDSELNTIQVQSRQLQRTLPVLLILIAILLTLLAAWIAYSQVVMINRALIYRRANSSEAAFKPEAVSQSTTGQIGLPEGETAETIDSGQTDIQEEMPGESEQGAGAPL